ncbi:hypothetical protein HRQ91_00745 [Treponema parvum]|uniref:Uncharacterized protein n=1 Tax=Treponema parvum TaxID=138851 RepID=A0A975F2B3_9SPIR|nr:hypothetical protein [Treponema parvum]QTQ13098.1 hypothetical protein HRQ91_00745 [Treponema parvum]
MKPHRREFYVVFLARQVKTSVLRLRSGATTVTTWNSARIYANHNLIVLDGAKVVFCGNVFIVLKCGFYTAGILLILSAEIRDWNTPTLSRSVIMSGSEAACNPCKVIRPITEEDKKTCWNR